jgi:L-malate glycosyltransferase
MQILHLTTFLQGGAGLVIATLAAAQRSAGHDVVVITSATGTTGYGNYDGHLETLQRAGVALHLVDSMFRRELDRNLDVVSFVRQTYGGLAPFDVVHTHAAVPSLVALVLGGLSPLRRPILQTMHGWGVAKDTPQQRADVTLMNLVDRVIVPAETSAELLRTLGVSAERLLVIPYGVAERVQRPRTPHPVEDEMRRVRELGRLVCVCSGTVGVRKNQRLIISALAMLAPAQRPFCVFIGDGETSELDRLGRESGVADSVRIIGYRDDARHIAAQADCLVLPSLSEGQPLAVLEAFCDGVIVLGSAIPEIKALVTDDATGLVFDPRRTEDLARAFDAVRHLDGSRQKQMRQEARRLYEARHSAAAMSARYLAEYETCCG